MVLHDGINTIVQSTAPSGGETDEPVKASSDTIVLSIRLRAYGSIALSFSHDASRTEAIVIAQRRGILGEERERPHPPVRESQLTARLRLSVPAWDSGRSGKRRRSVEPTAPILPSVL
jgi:hypothetical protein